MAMRSVVYIFLLFFWDISHCTSICNPARGALKISGGLSLLTNGRESEEGTSYIECVSWIDGIASVKYEYQPKHGVPNKVKLFPCISTIWNSKNEHANESSSLQLPFDIWNNRNGHVFSNWKIVHSNESEDDNYRVGYRLLLNDRPKTNANESEDMEIMIWLIYQNEYPNEWGTEIKRGIELCGYCWNLYVSDDHNETKPNEWTFQSCTNYTRSVNDFDINVFLQWLYTFTDRSSYISIPRYLIAIQFGQEIAEGKGMFRITSFDVVVYTEVSGNTTSLPSSTRVTPSAGQKGQISFS
ncbi:endo-1,4-beta-D-glucanase [Reticulomyxa filosa]|uniref:Endo-1,4-beta-D-glucanase n=1 Tax=Reticulomyxa filosa TaxID=46433 RepID=X6MAK9_RETFI|nr:endo-1,4-beta-D-glucanase [Reticulomyxa filosa]|eukprot:ETO10869.1 endo-1,4-beta-D-glucanase [Reticulomyxa filosa]